MKKIPWLALILVTLAFVGAMRTSANQSAATISTGTPLPRIEGESLSARKVVLPDSVKGRIGLLVFSFSREAGGPARCWNETYARIGMTDRDAGMFGILMLSDIPWLFRGLAVSGIKSGIPAALHDRTVKVFTDDDVWRTRLGVKAPQTPHLVVVDRTSRVRWLYSAPCDGAGEQQLREQLKGLVAEKTPAIDRTRLTLAMR